MKKINKKVSKFIKNEAICNLITKIIYIIMSMIYKICIFILKNKNELNLNKEIYEEICKINNQRNKFEYKIKKINSIKYKYDLSIIIPAYNCEKYIQSCIKSILEQNKKYSFEIIIINDGSKDETHKILENYENYDFITIINQENKGVAAARNRGLDISKGEYIMFVDADDILSPNSIVSLLDNAKKYKASMVVGSYTTFNDGGECERSIQKFQILGQNDKDEILKIKGFPCMKVYKSNLFENIRFPDGYLFEDTIICYLVFSICDKIITIPDIVYNYRLHKESATKTIPNTKKCIDAYYVVEKMISEMERLGINMDFELYKFTVNTQLGYIMYDRIKKQDSRMVKVIFYMACNLVLSLKENMGDKIVLEGVNKNLEYAFINKNYYMWKLGCIFSKII